MKNRSQSHSTVGIYHSVEVEFALRNINLRLLDFASVFENEEERPRSLKWEDVNFFLQLLVNLGG